MKFTTGPLATAILLQVATNTIQGTTAVAASVCPEVSLEGWMSDCDNGNAVLNDKISTDGKCKDITAIGMQGSAKVTYLNGELSGQVFMGAGCNGSPLVSAPHMNEGKRGCTKASIAAVRAVCGGSSKASQTSATTVSNTATPKSSTSPSTSAAPSATSSPVPSTSATPTAAPSTTPSIIPTPTSSSAPTPSASAPTAATTTTTTAACSEVSLEGWMSDCDNGEAVLNDKISTDGKCKDITAIGMQGSAKVTYLNGELSGQVFMGAGCNGSPLVSAPHMHEGKRWCTKASIAAVRAVCGGSSKASQTSATTVSNTATPKSSASPSTSAAPSATSSPVPSTSATPTKIPSSTPSLTPTPTSSSAPTPSASAPTAATTTTTTAACSEVSLEGWMSDCDNGKAVLNDKISTDGKCKDITAIGMQGSAKVTYLNGELSGQVFMGAGCNGSPLVSAPHMKEGKRGCTKAFIAAVRAVCGGSSKASQTSATTVSNTATPKSSTSPSTSAAPSATSSPVPSTSATPVSATPTSSSAPTPSASSPTITTTAACSEVSLEGWMSDCDNGNAVVNDKISTNGKCKDIMAMGMQGSAKVTYINGELSGKVYMGAGCNGSPVVSAPHMNEGKRGCTKASIAAVRAVCGGSPKALQTSASGVSKSATPTVTASPSTSAAPSATPSPSTLASTTPLVNPTTKPSSTPSASAATVKSTTATKPTSQSTARACPEVSLEGWMSDCDSGSAVVNDKISTNGKCKDIMAMGMQGSAKVTYINGELSGKVYMGAGCNGSPVVSAPHMNEGKRGCTKASIAAVRAVCGGSVKTVKPASSSTKSSVVKSTSSIIPPSTTASTATTTAFLVATPTVVISTPTVSELVAAATVASVAPSPVVASTSQIIATPTIETYVTTCAARFPGETSSTEPCCRWGSGKCAGLIKCDLDKCIANAARTSVENAVQSAHSSNNELVCGDMFHGSDIDLERPCCRHGDGVCPGLKKCMEKNCRGKSHSSTANGKTHTFTGSNSNEITCAEKKVLDVDSLKCEVYESKPCCRHSGDCGGLAKCQTKNCCRK